MRVLRLNDDGPLHAPTPPDAKPSKGKKKNKKKQPALVAEETTRPPADNGSEPPVGVAGDEEE